LAEEWHRAAMGVRRRNAQSEMAMARRLHRCGAEWAMYQGRRPYRQLGTAGADGRLRELASATMADRSRQDRRTGRPVLDPHVRWTGDLEQLRLRKLGAAMALVAGRPDRSGRPMPGLGRRHAGHKNLLVIAAGRWYRIVAFRFAGTAKIAARHGD